MTRSSAMVAPPSGLVLRDIHQPVAPSWWPPAPGWWLVAAVVIAAVATLALWWRRRRRQRVVVVHTFDASVAAATSPAARVAAMSDLLRRAARRFDASADTLHGPAWLAFLDGAQTTRPFSQGPGALIAEGGFRRDVPSADADALLPVARARYLQLMGASRRITR